MSKNKTRTEDFADFEKDEDELPVVSTYGQILSGGAVLELIDSSADGVLRLLYAKGEQIFTSLRVEHDGRAYVVGHLNPSLQRAIRWPRSLAVCGSARELHEEMTALVVDGQFFLRPEAELIASLVLGSWVPEVLPISPTVWITATDTARAMELFELLDCACYHPMIITRLWPAGLLSLPRGLPLTVLVNQPNLPVGMRNLLRDSSFRRVGVLGSRGQILDISYPRVIFVGTQIAGLPAGTGHFHLALLPTDGSSYSRDWQMLDRIAAHFQPRLFKLRLNMVSRARQSAAPATSLKLSSGALIDKLRLDVPNDPDLTPCLAPLMQSQGEAALNVCTLESVLVEVLWSLVHPDDSKSVPPEIQTKDLADLVNTVFSARGELLQHNAIEVGLKLSALGGFTGKRRAEGVFLLFDLATRQQIHRLARKYKVGAPVAGCPDCALGSPATG